MQDTEILIVGAGVAGLACGLTLQQAGKQVRIFDSSDVVGGRVRTDEVEGFTLDRGFQVLLTAYPTCRKLLDFNQLELGQFEPGARIGLSSGNSVVSDPYRRPGRLLGTLLAPIGSLRDKLLIRKLRNWVTGLSESSVWEIKNQSTLLFLREFGFSEVIIDRFFRPFMAGIFLEEKLITSARMFVFVYRCFSLGMAALPAGGMGRIPMQLAHCLGVGNIQLCHPVASVCSRSIRLESGERLEAEAVVVATDGEQARQWFPELPERLWNGSTCYYFDAPAGPFGNEPLLWLNATGSGKINHVAVPSSVAAGYAPEGRSLISVNCVECETAIAGVDPVRDELARHFGPSIENWRFLRSYSVPRSLPRLTPDDVDLLSGVPRQINGIYLAGDFLSAGSLETAMASGVEAARQVLGSAV